MTSQIAADSAVANVIVERLPSKLLAQLENVRARAPGPSPFSSCQLTRHPSPSQASLPPQQTLETLDILSDLFARFRPLVLAQPALQKEALRVLISLIADGRVAVKKKAISTIGALVPSSGPRIFSSLANTLLDALKDGGTHADVGRTYIALVGTLAKSSPARVGGVLKEVMPSIIDVCKADEDEAEGAEEAREVGLQVRLSSSHLSPSGRMLNSSQLGRRQTLETLMLRCPTEITPFINQILQVSTNLVSYDPVRAGLHFFPAAIG